MIDKSSRFLPFFEIRCRMEMQAKPYHHQWHRTFEGIPGNYATGPTSMRTTNVSVNSHSPNYLHILPFFFIHFIMTGLNTLTDIIPLLQD
jgi:hypothetical protein